MQLHAFLDGSLPSGSSRINSLTSVRGGSRMPVCRVPIVAGAAIRAAAAGQGIPHGSGADRHLSGCVILKLHSPLCRTRCLVAAPMATVPTCWASAFRSVGHYSRR